MRYYGKEATEVPKADAFHQVEPSSQHKALTVAVFVFLSSSLDFYSASVSTLCRLSLVSIVTTDFAYFVVSWKTLVP